MTPIIQLGFDPQDDKLWWCDMHKWDTRDETPDTVKRPTEQIAFRGLFRQARLIQKKGVLINLSPLHVKLMQMEQAALTAEPVPENPYKWIADRIHGIPPIQVKAILDECSFVVLLREALGLKPIAVKWLSREQVLKRVA